MSSENSTEQFNNGQSSDYNNQQPNSSIMISNGNVAGIYLKQQLGYGSNFNIVSGNAPNYDSNDFYTASLMDKIQGKTDSMGIYKVYSNGKIIQIAQ